MWRAERGDHGTDQEVAGQFNGAGVLLNAVIACGLLLISCRNDLDNVAAVDIPAAAADRITTGADYEMTDAGQVRNRLRAGRISEWTGEPPRTEIGEGLELTFLDSVGRQISVLTARRGLIMPSRNIMQVFEEVVFVNAKGERLETEQLTWEQDSGKVRTDKAVRVLRRGDIIHGQGLVAAEDFSEYTIHRITGVLHVEDDTLAAAPQMERPIAR